MNKSLKLSVIALKYIKLVGADVDISQYHSQFCNFCALVIIISFLVCISIGKLTL